jgi:multidrug resistance efflux pump
MGNNKANGKEDKNDNKDDSNKDFLSRIKGNPYLSFMIIIVLIGAIVGGYIYWQALQSRIYIEKSEISAPIITISAQQSGVLEKIRVNEGDNVGKGKVVAQVGSQLLETKTSGIVVYVKNTPGQTVTSQDAIVKMIDPAEMRVIGRIEEDKGLKDIKVGQRVIFTVDAFGSKEYAGIVDSIASSSRQSDIVFSISDKRQQKEFEVNVKFDVSKYPDLKNGMSAKMWVFK